MNTKLLRKVQAHILEEPKRLHMGNWVRWTNKSDKEKPACGTVGCIAGWSVLLTSRQGKTFRQKVSALMGDEKPDVETLAIQRLKLTRPQCYRLFYQASWPQLEKEAFDLAQSATARAVITAARIDLFIKSRGRE